MTRRVVIVLMIMAFARELTGQTPTVVTGYDLSWHTAADTTVSLKTSTVTTSQVVVSPAGTETTTVVIGQPVRVQFEHEGKSLSYAIPLTEQPSLIANNAYVLDVFSLYTDGTRYGPTYSNPFTALAPPVCAIAIAPATVPDGTVGVAYNTIVLTATGGTAPYGFTVTAGALPPGLIFVSAQIAGTPTGAGTFSFTVRAADSVGCFQDLVYTVAIVAAPPPPPPVGDTTAPVVSALTVKRNGNSGKRTCTATVTDAVGVASVTFLIDGYVMATLTMPTSGTAMSGTYSVQTAVSTGTHTVTADARDAAGNLGTRSTGFTR